jgi:mono/diheme cytochrome c family protein
MVTFLGVAACIAGWAGSSACGGTGRPMVTAQEERGRTLYEGSCSQCHEAADNGTGRLAPPHGPQGHTWHHPNGEIIDIVLGRLDYPGRAMPSFQGKLSEEEVLAILAYLKTNWTPDQREFQEAVTRDLSLPRPPRQRP